MRRIRVVLVFVFLAGCGTNPGKQIPREAANAMVGSPETITAIVGLAYKGRGTVFDETTKSNVPFVYRAMSFRKGQWRQDETRLPDAPGALPVVQTMALDGKVAYNRDSEGATRLLSEDEVKIRTAELYHHPLGYLYKVFFRTDPPLGNTRTEGNLEAVDMTLDGVVYTLYVDSATKLPAKIVSKIQHSTLGEIEMESTFSDYVNTVGHRLPSHITRKLGGKLIADFTLDQQFSGPDLPNLEAPKEIEAAAN